MSTCWDRRLQFTAACGVVVAYAGLAHYCNTSQSHRLGAALALTPSTMLFTVLAWRWTQPLTAIVLTLLIAAVLCLAWPFLEKNFSFLYLTEESLVYGVLASTFGRSLFGKRTALCTQLADRLHGPLTAAEVDYTRRVTAAWTAFFFAITAGSIAIYQVATLRTWSFFINFCVLPLIGAMFMAEYLVRQRVLPKVKRVGLMATVRVYFAGPGS